MMNISKILFRLFVLIAAALVAVPCMKKGMFLDGVNYANVANNLANGKGTIWHFTYSDTFLGHYTHQLPLMLWSEGLLFYLFGDSLMVERIFCLLLFVLNSFAVVSLWSVCFPSYKQLYGLPLVLWVITPIVFWGFGNHVQELMMSLCSLWSITFLIRYFRSGFIWQMLLAGLFCFISGFCKGVQGLFPLVGIALYYLIMVRGSIKKLVVDQVVFVIPISFCLGSLWLYPPSRQMLIDNFDDRLRSTFVDQVQDTTSFRFDLWLDLCAELLVPLAFCIVVILMAKLAHRKIKFHWNKYSVFLFLIGLSASLPLIVTLEQRRFYLITSVGFFAVALGGVVVPILYSVKVKKKVGRVISIGLSVVSTIVLIFAFLNTGTYKRDKELLVDVDSIGSVVSERIISADPELIYHYLLIAYLARKYNVSLQFEKAGNCSHHLTTKGRNGHSKAAVNGEIYDLLQVD